MSDLIKSINCTWRAIPAISDQTDFQCPSCGSSCVIVSAEDEDKKIADFEAGNYKWIDYNLKSPEPPGWEPRPHPGYIAMLEWGRQQPRCFKHIMHLHNSYRKHTGNTIDMVL